MDLATRAHTIRTLLAAGFVRPEPPRTAARALLTLRRWGPTLAAGVTTSAIRRPDAHAIVDERGALTWRELHERSNAIARGLAAAGVREDTGVAILCRNHRGFVESTLACMKLGAAALYLNTMFAGPQIAEVVEREGPVALIYDQEFEELVAGAGEHRHRWVAWAEPSSSPAVPALEDLVGASSRDDLQPPSRPGRIVILTSGTTGTPKGAQRGMPESLDPVASLLSKIPLHARETTTIAAPLFHSWGMAHFSLALALSSTMVLRRRFDPEATLAATAQHRATALVVVPVMLQRMLELPDEAIARHDLSALRVIAVSGSALPGELALRAMDRFGDVLFNLYGSTEVAWATIATPEDLRAAPGTAGRPPRGTTVRIVDEAGRAVPPGTTGRIFVGNEMVFEGYTGGGGKEIVEGLLSTGDVGHLDPAGRLFVDGRDDEMIISGGENVFPREVEDVLADHEAVHEVAVIGVEDEQFGQRLKAFVVPAEGHAPDEAALQAHVKRTLAGFKVPREVVFLPELPRNATGKVLKRELARDLDHGPGRSGQV